MSDLIRREDAIKKIVELDTQVYEGNRCVGIRTYLTKEEIIYAIDDIPSAEPERTAKVSNQIFNNSNPYIAGAWIGTCECGGLVSYSSKYCHMCGARLEWE